ncbi:MULTISPECIES: hypothetical protein [unclassified Thioalkalivibrio]|uniref:hypothetical protein n=1 Tax=unclassified Thioalkalivibrio TaxID=2621013 RepID=UPI0003719844|nr:MULTISPECIES: hypothetical protein [unclassified Thioalkalivibrio]
MSEVLANEALESGAEDVSSGALVERYREGLSSEGSYPAARMLSVTMRSALVTGQDRSHAMTREMVEEIRNAALLAASEAADKYGLSLDDVDTQFGEREAELSFRISAVDLLGMDRYARMLLSDYANAGLEASDFGREFHHQGHRFVITGLRDSSRPGLFEVRLFDLESQSISFVASAAVAKVIYGTQ